MESHSRSIFLTDTRRQASLRGWHRFFRSENLRLNPHCKPNARYSIVPLVVSGAAVTKSYTTNPTSQALNPSSRQPAMQTMFRCCSCQSSIVNSILSSKSGVLQSVYIANTHLHQRSLTLRRMLFALLIQCRSP